MVSRNKQPHYYFSIIENFLKRNLFINICDITVVIFERESHWEFRIQSFLKFSFKTEQNKIKMYSMEDADGRHKSCFPTIESGETQKHFLDGSNELEKN